MRLQAVRVFWFLSMLMFIFLTLSGGLAAQEPKASQPSPTPEEKEPSVPSLAELSPLATELAERSAVLEKDIAAVFDLSAAEKSLAKIVKRQKKTLWTIARLKDHRRLRLLPSCRAQSRNRNRSQFPPEDGRFPYRSDQPNWNLGNRVVERE